MIVRPVSLPYDMLALRAMHERQGERIPEYGKWVPFPDITLPNGKENRQWPIKLIAENGNGPEAAVLARVSLEVFLMVGRAGARRAVAMLDKEARERTLVLGINEACAWLPEQVEEEFGGALRDRDWRKMLWPSYCLSLGTP